MKEFMFKGIISAFVSTSIFLYSCQNKNISVPITFETITADTVIHLISGDTASPTAKINITFLYAKGDSARKVNHSILSSKILKNDFVDSSSLQYSTSTGLIHKFILEYIQKYRKTCNPLYSKDKTTMSCHYEFLSKGQIIDNGKNVCLVFNKYVYTGGANGMSAIITLNVNKENGNIINKKELLKNISINKAKKEIIQSLARQLRVEDTQQLKDSLYVFYDTPVYIPDNFIIGKDSITFIYGDLEIAPHYMGVLQAKVAKKDILPQNSPLNSF